MNYELLHQLYEHCLFQPLTVNMSVWFTSVDYNEAHPCGTEGCIAGHAIRLARGKEMLETLNDQVSVFDVAMLINPLARQAQKLLDLDDQQARRLFFVRYWPAKIKASVTALRGSISFDAGRRNNRCARTGTGNTTRDG